MKPLWLSSLLIVGLVGVGRAQTRQPNLVLLPAGYVGWIRVSYGVKDAPRLPIWKGYRLHKFGRDGKIATSSLNPAGWAKDRFFYSTKEGWKELPVTTSEGQGKVWGRATGSREIISLDAEGEQIVTRTPETSTAFIGTRKQFRATKIKRPN